MYDKKVIDVEVQKFLATMPIGSKTQYHYRHYIVGFYWWCIDNGMNPEHITQVQVRQWFDEHHWSSSTMHFAAAALHSYYKWKYGESHPVCSIRVKRVDPGPQRTLTEQEVEMLLSSINTRTEKGIRDLALLTLMIDTGLRASEVCNILMKKLDIRNKKLSVVIKGGRWGEAVFFDYTANCLNNWLGIRPHIADPDCETVFCGIGGKSPGESMTRFGLRTTVERLAKHAGIDHFSPHAMRRTFATLATEYGAPTRLVQLAGRWRDIRMVETYTKTLQADKLQPYSVVNRLMGFTPNTD